MNDHDYRGLIAALDSGDRLALHALADWYEERDSDLGAGLRWILREEKIPGRPWKFDLSGYITGLDTWFRGNGPVADRESLPDSVYRELAGDSVYQYLSEYPTPSAAYLDAAAAAVAALRSCCGQLWGEGEACEECGSRRDQSCDNCLDGEIINHNGEGRLCPQCGYGAKVDPEKARL